MKGKVTRTGLFRCTCCLLLAFFLLGSAAAREALSTIPVHQLPPEARTTLKLIQQGGPFPYSKDGSVFGNFEGRLPRQPRGYYREYTVPTPGISHRGARRIVTGQAREYFYTANHYRTFRRIRELP